MTTDEVLAELKSRGARPEHLAMFPRRLEPDGEHPGDEVFRIPVPLQDGQYLAVSFSFGQPDADELKNWAPVWHSVDGPVSLDELKALDRG